MLAQAAGEIKGGTDIYALAKDFGVPAAIIMFVLAEGRQETEVLSAQRPAVAKLLKEGKLVASDILVAACVAWALDIPADLIRAGVKSYGQSPSSF